MRSGMLARPKRLKFFSRRRHHKLLCVSVVCYSSNWPGVSISSHRESIQEIRLDRRSRGKKQINNHSSVLHSHRPGNRGSVKSPYFTACDSPEEEFE